MDSLKPYQSKIIINVMNKLNILPTDANIIKHVNNIYNYILVKGQYATTTKRDYLIVLCKVLRELKQTKTAEYIYNKDVIRLSKEYTDNEYKQTLDEREQENYIKYDVLLKKTYELINIYNDNPNKKNMIKLLVLALYTLQPPLRNDYYNMILINNDDFNDNTRNFLLRDNKDNLYIIINNDKVIKTHGKADIPIIDTTLKQIIKLYLNNYAYNNIYLFENKDGTPYTKKQIQYIINKMFDDKTLTIYTLRSSYVSNFYKNNLDLLSRRTLADNMRHSPRQAELSYCKYFNEM